jgi:lipid-binding SYLF domain-containing protein
MAAPDKGIPRICSRKLTASSLSRGSRPGPSSSAANTGRGIFHAGTGTARLVGSRQVRIEGGSVGFQIGGSTTDLIMLVMSERGADKLLSSKFTLGAEGSVAAGPVGRTATAQTVAHMRAEILSWSRSQGLFVGLALEGATLRQDLDDNATLYGKKLENREIVTNGGPAPKSAAPLMALLNKHSPRER